MSSIYLIEDVVSFAGLSDNDKKTLKDNKSVLNEFLDEFLDKINTALSHAETTQSKRYVYKGLKLNETVAKNIRSLIDQNEAFSIFIADPPLDFDTKENNYLERQKSLTEATKQEETADFKKLKDWIFQIKDYINSL